MDKKRSVLKISLISIESQHKNINHRSVLGHNSGRRSGFVGRKRLRLYAKSSMFTLKYQTKEFHFGAKETLAVTFSTIKRERIWRGSSKTKRFVYNTAPVLDKLICTRKTNP